MNRLSRFAATVAVVGLGLGAVQAAAQNAPATPAKPPAQAQLAPLTADQVKTVIAGRLVTMRSDLKVGKVTEKDADTYDVELLNADGTVAEHALVDKMFARPAGALQKGRGMHGRFGPGDCPMGKGGFGPGMGPGMGMGPGGPGGPGAGQR